MGVLSVGFDMARSPYTGVASAAGAASASGVASAPRGRRMDRLALRLPLPPRDVRAQKRALLLRSAFSASLYEPLFSPFDALGHAPPRHRPKACE